MRVTAPTVTARRRAGPAASARRVRWIRDDVISGPLEIRRSTPTTLDTRCL